MVLLTLSAQTVDRSRRQADARKGLTPEFGGEGGGMRT